jgi:succinoglycan biosynthesis protein ExoO
MSGMLPAVSVIMPVYNGGQWLARAIESVLRQTLSNLEILVVDDASEDDTAGIAEEFARRDGRVRLLRQPRNRGQAAARNLALENARGEWMAPVDADDEILPDRLRVLVEAGEQEHADLIADGILFQGATTPGTPAEFMTWSSAEAGCERLSALTFIRSGTAGRSLGYLKPLMRRRFLEHCGLRYAEDLRFAEDFNLYARALFCGARFLLYPQSYYVYRQTPASASRTEIARIARHAVANSQRLRADVPQGAPAELTAALDEYEQRWSFLYWWEQMKHGVAGRQFRQVARLLLNLPASPGRVVRFARARARLKRQQRAEAP